jgi:hypothetical protein
MAEALKQRGVMEEMLEEAVREGRLFRVGRSFLFSAQIPDDSVGCSGSRCSNCNSETAYCVEICEHCTLPFVGPFGFPQLPVWNQLSLEEKNRSVQEVYMSDNHGRLGSTNVESIPLNPRELERFENLDLTSHDEAEALFQQDHGISSQEIKKILFS